ncbi:hypothetical protein Q2K19_12435 [Micromonospora soli]|uniref:hypothetical protein n=1 Tax=Micromonospora sp. NBRC 110009 TaxID=3061627 RepID=UPI002671D405|nr:hypothetical protein [Micromonospora sp. NBRC 110009]WKU01208.1 hypothetical protein Q2K19_12435 [Micromonospora sp. NBRC 110009]
MHAHLRAARRLTGVLAITLPALLAACTADLPRPAPTSTADPAPAEADAARDELAALAAAAQDRHLTATYVFTTGDGPDRTVTVTSGNDGSWRVDVPGWGQGGTVDVSLAATADGLFQCALPSAGHPEPAGCVRLGDPDDAVPRKLDPKVQHPFTDWLEVLTDRRAPLAVSPATPPTGAAGECYSVETTSASLNAPLDVGIYCYRPDGTPSAVRAAFGTLRLAGEPGPAPATVQLAGPVTEGDPVGPGAPSPTDSTSPATE